MIGTSTPVEVINFVNDFVFGRSRRASISKQSTIGVSTNTEASIGKIFTLCCNRARAGKTSALAPVLLVKSRILATLNNTVHEQSDTNKFLRSYTYSVKIPLILRISDLFFRMIFRLSLVLKPRNLSIRKSSYPYLSSDTYYELCDYTITSEKELNDFIRKNENFISVYLLGDLVKQFTKRLEEIKPKSIEKLIIMESDTLQTIEELKPALIVAEQIYSNNLIGTKKNFTPIPLGLERRCYRSAGVISDFTKPYKEDISKRNIPFLVAWNDQTNPNRAIYRREFSNSSNSLIIEKRISPKTIHTLMRRTMFVPAPAGNGLDSHRTWEALYLGCIPVILRKEYCGDDNWPVMVVDSWDELLSLNLIEIKKLYKDNFISTEKVMSFTKELLEKIKS